LHFLKVYALDFIPNTRGLEEGGRKGSLMPRALERPRRKYLPCILPKSTIAAHVPCISILANAFGSLFGDACRVHHSVAARRFQEIFELWDLAAYKALEVFH